MTNLDTIPWMQVTPGFEMKLVRGETDDDTETRALLLRLQPGTIVARHRHTGEVHAYHLAGQRKLLDTGAIVGAGSYVYEPPGNVDSWMAVGDEPLLAFVTLSGAVEYLDDAGHVVTRATAATARARHRALVA